MLDRHVDVRHTPVGYCSTRARSYPLRVWIQPEFVAANVEADVERLVEVGLNAEGRAVPRLGALQVGYMIDDRAQTEDHQLLQGRGGLGERGVGRTNGILPYLGAPGQLRVLVRRRLVPIDLVRKRARHDVRNRRPRHREWPAWARS